MKSYLSLVPLEARAHRRQNRMTMLCIIIAVFLVTGVFSLANMAVKMEYDRQLIDNGNWHISVTEIGGADVRDEDAQKLMAENSVRKSSRYDVLNYGLDREYYLNGKKLTVMGADSAILDIYYTPLSGSYPAGTGEIALTENAVEIYGLSVGDTVTLHFSGAAREYMISGIAEISESMRLIREQDCIGAFLSVDGYKELCAQLGEPYRPTVFLQLHRSLHLKSALETLLSKYNITNYSENTAVMGMSGLSSSNYIQGCTAWPCSSFCWSCSRAY